MEKRFVLISVLVLILIHDNIEFLYYGVDDTKKICLLYFDKCFRADSFVSFASQKVQYIIVDIILMICFIKEIKLLKWLLFGHILYFVEFFFTYNEPITKVFLPSNFYVPVSIAMVKIVIWAWVFLKVLKKSL